MEVKSDDLDEVHNERKHGLDNHDGEDFSPPKKTSKMEQSIGFEQQKALDDIPYHNFEVVIGEASDENIVANDVQQCENQKENISKDESAHDDDPSSDEDQVMETKNATKNCETGEDKGNEYSPGNGPITLQNKIVSPVVSIETQPLDASVSVQNCLFDFSPETLARVDRLNTQDKIRRKFQQEKAVAQWIFHQDNSTLTTLQNLVSYTYFSDPIRMESLKNVILTGMQQVSAELKLSGDVDQKQIDEVMRYLWLQDNATLLGICGRGFLFQSFKRGCSEYINQKKLVLISNQPVINSSEQEGVQAEPYSAFKGEKEDRTEFIRDNPMEGRSLSSQGLITQVQQEAPFNISIKEAKSKPRGHLPLNNDISGPNMVANNVENTYVPDMEHATDTFLQNSNQRESVESERLSKLTGETVATLTKKCSADQLTTAANDLDESDNCYDILSSNNSTENDDDYFNSTSSSYNSSDQDKYSDSITSDEKRDTTVGKKHSVGRPSTTCPSYDTCSVWGNPTYPSLRAAQMPQMHAANNKRPLQLDTTGGPVLGHSLISSDKTDSILITHPLQISITKPTVATFFADDHYRLAHGFKGFALVLNITKFSNAVLDRNGAAQDTMYMKNLWTGLGYKVTTHEGAFTLEEVKKILEAFKARFNRYGVSENLSSVVFIGSHGVFSEIFTSDGQEMNLYEDVVYQFDANKCPQLIGRPKIFLIQACQPFKTVDVGPLTNRTEVDKKIPTKIDDAIVSFSSIPGEQSRRGIGSWYGYCLAKVLMENAHNTDLLNLLTKTQVEMQKMNASSNKVFGHGQLSPYMNLGIKTVYFNMTP